METKPRAQLIAESRARSYELTDPEERKRLLREVRGYLHTCHSKHGTDWEGRNYAMLALDEWLTEFKP